jgi:hypothetical protein
MNGMDGTVRFWHTDSFISSFDGREMFAIYAGCKGTTEWVGNAAFTITEKSLVPSTVEVHPNFQRYGIATTMYRFAEELTGKKVRPSRRRSMDALLFWKGFRKKKDWKKDYFVFYPRPLVRRVKNG